MAIKPAKRKESVVRIGERRQIVIPKEVLRTLKVREGDLVALSKHANGVLIKPKRSPDPDDMLTPSERAMVTKARREMREGRSISLAQLEHELASQRPSRRRKTS